MSKLNWYWCGFFFFVLIFAGGAFEGVIDDTQSPFGYMKGEGIDAGCGEHEWICNKDKPRTDAIFNGLGPVDGKISGSSEYNIFNSY